MRKGSKQRDCIIDILRNDRTHPTAQEVYRLAAKRIPNISLGTVYRNLEYLTAMGEVKKLRSSGGIERYDYVRQKHNHALCTRCGKLFDFEYQLDAAALQSAIGDENVFKLSDADFLVAGVCGQCRGLDSASK